MYVMKTMTGSQIEEVLKELEQDFRRRERKATDVLQEKGEYILQRIIEEIEVTGAVDSLTLLHYPESMATVSAEEISVLFEAMAYFAKEPTIDLDNPFHNEHYFYRYQGKIVELYKIMGQGTEILFTEPNQILLRNTPEENIMDFEDLLKKYDHGEA